MTAVTLRPWGEGDLALVVAANTAEMTAHLGGPETAAEVRARHERYLRLGREGAAHMFAVEHDGVAAGGIGWWTTEHEGRAVAETGWFTLPATQGRGVARAALPLLVADAVAHAPASELLAFPSVGNAASDAVCRHGGFELRGEADFPFRGTVLHVHVWALDLAARRSVSAGAPS